jgi:hypothetical protein
MVEQRHDRAAGTGPADGLASAWGGHGTQRLCLAAIAMIALRLGGEKR